MKEALGSLTDIRSDAPSRVLVFRALQLGDLLCSVPAFRALRLALPRTRLTLLGLPWARAFANQYSHLFDDYIEFPGFPGLPEIPFSGNSFPDFLSRVRQRHFDWVLQMHGSGVITNLLVSLFGARKMAGYFLPGQFRPPGAFLPFDSFEHEVWKHLRFMTFLGVPAEDESLDFPVSADDEKNLAALAESTGVEPGSLVCVHPGAAETSRCWPAENFARVADCLSSRGFRVILTGTEKEKELTRRVASLMAGPSSDWAGLTSLGVLGALFKKARLVICNDTGVSHLAAALKVPSVVTLTRSEARSWPPLDRLRHRVVYRFPETTVNDVISQACDLLNQEGQCVG